MAKIILTVDDSASARQLIAFTLEEAGFKTIQAEDGEQALQILSQNKIDAIITDLNMPKIDGIELIKKVRSLNDYKFTPIIMLTTESQEEKKAQGKAAGATGWIVKPFKPEQLIAVIYKVVG
jgi:two-component system chemotaxis response regulator CheY